MVELCVWNCTHNDRVVRKILACSSYQVHEKLRVSISDIQTDVLNGRNSLNNRAQFRVVSIPTATAHSDILQNSWIVVSKFGPFFRRVVLVDTRENIELQAITCMHVSLYKHINL